MLYTNHKTIVHKNNDEQALLHLLSDVKNYLINIGEGEVDFQKDESLPFPAYLIPEGVTFIHLKDALGDTIGIRSINEDSVIVSLNVDKEYKHDFTDDELSEKASDTMRTLYALDKLKADFKEHKKKVDAEIEEKNNHIEVLKMQYTQGFEYQNVPCRLEINCVAKKRTYISIETGEIIAEETMRGSDSDYFIKHNNQLLLSVPTKQTTDAEVPAGDELPM